LTLGFNKSAGYDAIFPGSGDQIIEVACWTHARRKFFDARNNYPREAHQVLDWIGQLYDIEDRARTLSDEARRKLRVAEADPLLDKIEAYLAELSPRFFPRVL
jgi:transposase